MTRNAPSARFPLFDSGLIAVAESLAVPAGLVTTVVLTRHLGPSEYSRLALATGWIVWIEWTLATLLARPSIRWVGSAADPLDAASSVVRTYLVAGAFATLAAFAGAPTWAAMLGNVDLAEWIRLYALDIFFFAATQGYRTAHIGFGEFRSRAYATAAKWIFRAALVAAMAAAGFGIRAAILAVIGSSIVELAIVSWKSPVAIRKGSLRKALPHYAIAGSTLAVGAICLRLFERLDLFLLSRLHIDPAVIGGYSAIQNVTIVAGIATATISPTLLSVLVRRLKQDLDPAGAAVQAAAALRIPCLLLPLLSAAHFATATGVRLVFGARFEFASPILDLLLWTIPATVLLSFLQAILTAWGHLVLVSAVSVCMVPAALVLHTLLIPQWQGYGAAITVVAISWIAVAASALAVSRAAGLPLPYATFARSLAVVAAILLVRFRFAPASEGWLVCAAACLAAVTLQTLLGEYTVHDRARAQALLQRFSAARAAP